MEINFIKHTFVSVMKKGESYKTLIVVLEIGKTLPVSLKFE